MEPVILCNACRKRHDCPLMKFSYAVREVSCYLLRDKKNFLQMVIEDSKQILKDIEGTKKETARLMQESKKLRESNLKRMGDIIKKLNPPVRNIPIVLKYSYAEFVDMAFDIDTPNNTAIKYQKAIKRATAKGSETNNLFFTIPFLQATGRIGIIPKS